MNRDFLAGAVTGCIGAAMVDAIGWAFGINATIPGHLVAALWFAWLCMRPAAGKKGSGE